VIQNSHNTDVFLTLPLSCKWSTVLCWSGQLDYVSWNSSWMCTYDCVAKQCSFMNTCCAWENDVLHS